MNNFEEALSEEDEELEPEELLPANILTNLVMCNKDKTVALDLITDKYCIIVYERRLVEKPKHKQKGLSDSKVEKWTRVPGPYQASISQALNKVREILRKRNLLEVKTLDKLIEHEAKVTKEVFECFDANLKELRAHLGQKVIKQETEPSQNLSQENVKVAPTVLTSEQLFAAKKANALSTGPKRRGRPPRAN
jgi:hypothetical protein